MFILSYGVKLENKEDIGTKRKSVAENDEKPSPDTRFLPPDTCFSAPDTRFSTSVTREIGGVGSIGISLGGVAPPEALGAGAY